MPVLRGGNKQYEIGLSNVKAASKFYKLGVNLLKYSLLSRSILIAIS